MFSLLIGSNAAVSVQAVQLTCFFTLIYV